MLKGVLESDGVVGRSELESRVVERPDDRPDAAASRNGGRCLRRLEAGHLPLERPENYTEIPATAPDVQEPSRWALKHGAERRSPEGAAIPEHEQRGSERSERGLSWKRVRVVLLRIEGSEVGSGYDGHRATASAGGAGVNGEAAGATVEAIVTAQCGSTGERSAARGAGGKPTGIGLDVTTL